MSRGDVRWRFIGVYGWAKKLNKHQTWELIRHICADRERKAMRELREVLDDCDLHDL